MISKFINFKVYWKLGIGNWSLKVMCSLFFSVLILLFSTTSVFALPEGVVPAPEIIHPFSSNFCTDFDLEVKTSEESPLITPGVQGTSFNEVSGSLTMEQENVPDFSMMQKDLNFSLSKLMPQDLIDILKIEGDSLKTNARHFVMGIKDGEQIPPDNDKTPESEVTYPAWWTSLLGETKIVCGIFGTCKPPKSPIIKILPAAKGKFSTKSKCIPGQEAKDTDIENLNDTQTEFKTRSVWEIATSIIEKIIDGITKFFTKTDSSTKLVNKTRGNLSGGRTFSEQNPFDIFIPQGLKPSGKGAVLSTAKFNSSAGNRDDKNKFINKGRDWFLRCMQVCSLYPPEMVHSVDPLCPSCNTADYQVGSSGIDDPYLDMTLCQLRNNACDYYEPGSSSPCCEGTCNPYEFRQRSLYESGGCVPPYLSPPYNATDCNDASICRIMTFDEKNPDGGFGACQYQNPQVCVRTDREEVGSCAAVCNWWCCMNQPQ